MTSCSHKRRRAGADDHVKNNGRPKEACVATGLAAGGEAAAAVATTSPEDYSSMECWDKRYREGMFVEWYCGFDHVRPLFERFVPKVEVNARTYTRAVACFSWLLRREISTSAVVCNALLLFLKSNCIIRRAEPYRRVARTQQCSSSRVEEPGDWSLESKPVGIHAILINIHIRRVKGKDATGRFFLSET